tara:strand:- start:9324 stop:11354 length:2031 start_codon:yes stop_codon:yes gene_type:complete
MSIGKRLITTGSGGVTPSCTTDTTDIFDDGHGVALYSLDYDASTAPDATTDYSGTSTNVEFGIDGQINWGARFNGTNSSISIADGGIGNNATARVTFSISLWIKTTVTSAKAIINDYDGVKYAFYVQTNANGTLNIGNSFSGGGSFTSGTTVVNDGNWHNLVLINNTSDNTQKLFIDGNNTPDINHALNTGTKNAKFIQVGYYATTVGYIFNGDIDQVRFFTSALTESQMDTLYTETACVYTGTTQSHLFGCIANYNLDSDAKESMGVTAYDGTETNVTYEFGRFGAAAVFNGSSRIEVSNASKPSLSTVTISFWLKSTETSTQALMGEGYTSYWGNLQIALQSNKLAIKTGNASTVDNPTVSSTSNVNTGLWVHCAVTMSGNTVQIFINGSLETTQTLTVTRVATTNPFTIGQMYATGGALFTSWLPDCSIDQVRIFSSVLSPSNIDYLFENEKQAYITKNASNPFGDGNEIAFYKMENNANDSTGSNNGTNYGATFTTTDALFGTYSASFDGSNDYIQTPLSLNSNDASISFWAKADTLGGSRPIYMINNRNGILVSYAYGSGSDSLTQNTAGQSTLINSTTWTSQYNHIVVNMTGFASSYSLGSFGSAVNVEVFLNGNLLGTTTQTPYGQSDNCRIGRQNGTLYFDGLMDQVRIFNRALEGDEVFKLYAEVIN